MSEVSNLDFPAAPYVAAAALVVLMVVRGLYVWKRERHVYVGDALWTVPFLVLLALVGHFCLEGALESEIDQSVVSWVSIVLFIFGALTLFHRRFNRALDALSMSVSEPLRVCIALALLAIVSVVSAWLLDFVWLESSSALGVQYVAVTAVCFAAMGGVLYFIGQRSGALLILIPLLAVGMGIAQYFVLEFKGVPLMPTDLLALETAGAVAGGYEYSLTLNMMVAFGVAGACICAFSFVEPRRIKSLGAALINVVINVLFGMVLISGITGWFETTKLQDILEVEYDRWQPICTYNLIGFAPAFLEIMQDMAIPVPENYEASTTEETLGNLAAQFDETLATAPERLAAEAQFNEVKPAVIVVMNETFSDMSIYDEIRAAGYEGPQNYKSLSDTLQRGTLSVPVLGGGTANTEFEFLTGNSIAFIGAGKYPYQLYDLSESDSLAKQLADVGYSSTAIHPQNPINWKRSTAYKQLGFEEFLSQDDFEGAPWYHSGATDAATYDKILELLEQNDDPQFIFDVTMQNHSGYGVGTVPEEDMVDLDIPGIEDPDFRAQLGVYLACIERSDQDFAYFIERLRAIERPVVFVFFGDHQPGLSSTLDETLYGDGDELLRNTKLYSTIYTVWSNYEIAGVPLGVERETSSSQLAAQIMYRIGAPLTDRQKADLMLGQSITSFNGFGYLGADGLRYALDAESPYSEAFNQMQSIQYLMFASKIK